MPPSKRIGYRTRLIDEYNTPLGAEAGRRRAASQNLISYGINNISSLIIRKRMKKGILKYEVLERLI